MTSSDFQARVDAIYECDAEPSEQVWSRLNSGSSREQLSHEFGYSLQYLDRLISEAVERRLLAGVSYHDIKKVIRGLEDRCWSILLSLQPGSGRLYHAGAEAVALRAQALELHRLGASKNEISHRLRLNSVTVRRLLILGMLDESALHQVQRLFWSPRMRTKGFRWEAGSSKKIRQERAKPQSKSMRRSSSTPPPLKSQDAGRLRRQALKLHIKGHSPQEIQILLAVSKTASRAILAVALVEWGWTLEAAGSYVGLSRERVRQLANEGGVNVRKLKEGRRAAIQRNLEHRQNLICDWVKLHPGCTLDEIAVALHLESLGKRDVPRHVSHLVLGARTVNDWTTAQFSKETIISALRHAFEVRNPLSSMYSEEIRLPVSGPFYEKLRRSGKLEGPSDVRIIQVFGSWSAACESAGVPSPIPPRVEYSRRWTDEELVEHLAAFLLQATSTGIDQFDSWCREDEARPSSGTIRNQLRKSWSAAKEAALWSLRRQWIAAPSSGHAESTISSV